jgi:hypothetical protein
MFIKIYTRGTDEVDTLKKKGVTVKVNFKCVPPMFIITGVSLPCMYLFFSG